jgi:hypothetical protein
MQIEQQIRKQDYFEPAGFYGTTAYWRPTLSKRFLATDGAIFVFRELKCFWVADIISSYINIYDEHESWFFVVDVLVGHSKATVVITDGNYNVVVEQKIEFTDLKKNLRFFVAEQDNDYVCMLPSEY